MKKNNYKTYHEFIAGKGEKYWQEKWEKDELYKTSENKDKPKYYILDMFPYPSGVGLHVGHPKGYIATDIFARAKMMQNFNVLHPMGWDAFGLPAENYAIKNKVHPKKAVEKNIEVFKKQLEKLGFCYDWSREINTTDPKFYKWTQWTFIQMLKKGLAYESYEPINWCPSCKTGLANEDLEDGKCERCGSEIEQKPMRQWVLKITDYAERMLNDLDKLPDWDESIKEMQKNWIGKSEGATTRFKVPTPVKLGFLTQEEQKVKLGFKTQLNPNRTFWFITFPAIKRKQIFETKEECLTIINCIFNSCVQHNFNLHELSVLDDHVHILVDTDKDIKIDKIYKYLKGFSSKRFIENYNLYEENSKGRHIWTPKGEYSIIKNEKEYNKVLEYIQKNPGKDSLNRKERLFTENLENLFFELEVFTTRPDTLFGCTYMVVAPEHEIIKKLEVRIKNLEEVREYIEKSKRKTELERTDLAKEKTGVKIEGLTAINPVNNEEIPIFVADYVLLGYGTGAIMAVPAHDTRDYEFAKKYNLPIKTVVTTDKKDVIGIGAMIETQDGRFLFQRRDKNTDRNPGMLAFFGGGIENNESAIETLKREIKEELNLDITDNYVLLNRLETQKFPGKYLNIYYIDDINEQKIKLGEGEAVEKLKLSEALNRDDVTLLTKRVIKYLQENKCFTENGVNVNSDFLDGLETKEAKQKMIKWLEKNKLGKKAINYKIKDWVFSRQRYWGEPIPVVHCDNCGVVSVPEEDLPVNLPEVENYEPTGTGESPLANIKDWVNTKCPKCKGPAKRETNTMPQWAGSSWYFLRFIDPDNDDKLVDKAKDKYWSPVDFYVGGAEHATRHLIYARFWHKFLYDIGAVNYDEPFKRLQHVGLISGEDGRKMSKRWGNVINPDDIVEKYGADAMRVYEMFMGPFSQPCAWSTNGLIGARKFLDKVWKLSARISPNKTNKLESNTLESNKSELGRLLHKTIKKVGEDIEGFKLNTAVSAMMILANEFEKEAEVPQNFYEKFIILLAPFAPHIAEELWSSFASADAEAMADKKATEDKSKDYSESIFKQPWPKYDPELVRDEEIELVLQVNGKVRDKIMVSADISEEEAKKIAEESEAMKKWTEGKEVVKVIFVKGKLINIVVKL